MTKIQYSAMKFFAIINLVYCFLFLSNWLRGDGERLGYGSSDEGLMSTIGCKDQWSRMGYGHRGDKATPTAISMVRDVHGLGWWVISTQPTIPIIGVQPNPRGSGWTFFLIIIIIKLSIRITPPQIIMSITLDKHKHKLYEENLRFRFYLVRRAKK